MEIFLIKSNKQNDLKFIEDFSKTLSKNKSVLLLSFTRNKDKNIEDIFDMGGMITYDICDYFLGLIDLEKITLNPSENISFVISPLINSKYQVKKEDISKLLDQIKSYDYVIIKGLDENLLEEKKEIQIINEDEIEDDFKSTYFLVESNDKYFDIREYREKILEKPSKYLGLKKKDSTYEKIISNILEDKNEEIQKIGFFEKLKKKISQWHHLYL